MIVTLPRGDREYILKSERTLPPASQTVFLLRDLTERDRVRIMDTLQVGVGDDGARVGGTGTRTYTTVKAGLQGWRNIKDTEGKDVAAKLEGGTITDESLALLPWHVKIELQDAILSQSFPTEEEKGK